jgi:uncharacterized protein YbjQ (UPF0145 family)
MQLSFTASLARAHHPIGKVQGQSPWRADREPDAHDREIATRALVREAEDFDADAVVEIAYATEECHDGDGRTLRRTVAIGRAVRLALAA